MFNIPRTEWIILWRIANKEIGQCALEYLKRRRVHELETNTFPNWICNGDPKLVSSLLLLHQNLFIFYLNYVDIFYCFFFVCGADSVGLSIIEKKFGGQLIFCLESSLWIDELFYYLMMSRFVVLNCVIWWNKHFKLLFKILGSFSYVLTFTRKASKNLI